MTKINKKASILLYPIQGYKYCILTSGKIVSSNIIKQNQKMNTPAAHPTHDMTHNVVNSEESTRLPSSNGEDMPPVPSTCDNDAAGEVINPIPSHTATPLEPSATSARDMSPAPSACGTTGIPTSQDAASKPAKATRMAPNRLVHWNTLKSVVDNHLGPCSTCHLKGMRLEEKGSCSFATNLEIVCGSCDEQSEKNRKEIIYLNKRVSEMNFDVKKGKDKRRVVQLKRNHLQKVQDKKFLPARVSRQIKATRMKKVSARERLRTSPKNKGTIMEFEVNVRAMMSSFYGGTGGADIANIGSFFGVPGGKSWERAFSRHSPSMCKLITSVISGVMDASLKNEIKATISEKLEGMTKDEINIATKAYFDKDTENIPDAIKKLGIAVSYDMGWQKRATGKIYDSMSGHGFMIGCRTGNIIGFKVKSKTCSVCSKANFQNIPTEEHGCRINYEGSSGGMEAQVALELCITLHDDSGYNIYVEYIVSDDDSTMRAHLQYEDDSAKGKLPTHIPVPTFLADPSHRVKVMSSPIFKLAQGETKDPRQCKKIDALRIKKYIGCYIYQNRNLPISEMIKKAKAPIEHLFNCHEWCDPEWCWAKQLDAKQHELTTRIMEQNHQEEQESSSDSDSDESNWETDSDCSIPTPPVVNNTDDDDDDSDWATCCLSNSDEELEVEEMGLEEEKAKECACFSKYEETYDVDASIFTPDDLKEIKNSERVMMERNDRGYHCCKVKEKTVR